jgi:hypothetical protein
MKPFTAPAILIVGAPTRDGGMRLRAETQELTDEQKVVLLGYNNTFGHFLFQPNPIQESDIPKEAAKREGKSPGERLRGVLYLIYKESSGKDENFYQYYLTEMERVINHYKTKIGNTF